MPFLILIHGQNIKGSPKAHHSTNVIIMMITVVDFTIHVDRRSDKLTNGSWQKGSSIYCTTTYTMIYILQSCMYSKPLVLLQYK